MEKPKAGLCTRKIISLPVKGLRGESRAGAGCGRVRQTPRRHLSEVNIRSRFSGVCWEPLGEWVSLIPVPLLAIPKHGFVPTEKHDRNESSLRAPSESGFSWVGGLLCDPWSPCEASKTLSQLSRPFHQNCVQGQTQPGGQCSSSALSSGGRPCPRGRDSLGATASGQARTPAPETSTA